MKKALKKKVSKTSSVKAKKIKEKVKKVKVEKKVKKIKKGKEIKAPAEIGKTEKQKIIRAFALKQGDTGSPEVQVAIATQKITNLISHLKQNPKDNHSRRGLLKIVAKRRRILNYLQKKDEKRYKTLIKKLDLKK